MGGVVTMVKMVLECYNCFLSSIPAFFLVVFTPPTSLHFWLRSLSRPLASLSSKLCQIPSSAFDITSHIVLQVFLFSPVIFPVFLSFSFSHPADWHRYMDHFLRAGPVYVTWEISPRRQTRQNDICSPPLRVCSTARRSSSWQPALNDSSDQYMFVNSLGINGTVRNTQKYSSCWKVGISTVYSCSILCRRWMKVFPTRNTWSAPMKGRMQRNRKKTCRWGHDVMWLKNRGFFRTCSDLINCVGFQIVVLRNENSVTSRQKFSKRKGLGCGCYLWM